MPDEQLPPPELPLPELAQLRMLQAQAPACCLKRR
jgi:hypothetical protein